MSNANLCIGREYPEIFKLSALSAVHTIDLLFYYWQLRLSVEKDPITIMIRALQAAADRGVKVRIITTHAGVVALLRPFPFEVKVLHTGKTMHCKLAIFDESSALMGSHNMTRNAMEENWEISYLVEEAQSVDKLVQFFKTLWSL